MSRRLKKKKGFIARKDRFEQSLRDFAGMIAWILLCVMGVFLLFMILVCIWNFSTPESLNILEKKINNPLTIFMLGLFATTMTFCFGVFAINIKRK